MRRELSEVGDLEMDLMNAIIQKHKDQKQPGWTNEDLQFSRKRALRAIIVIEIIVSILGLMLIWQEHIFMRIGLEKEIRRTGYIVLDTGKYKGDTDFGYFDGKGVFYFNTKNVYSGDFVSNLMDGTGTLTLPGVGKYRGDFFRGEKGGHGTFRWKDGSSYTGAWKNDKMSGEGTYKSGNTTYEGYFDDNAFKSGDCKIRADGKKQVLRYKRGKIINADITFPSGDKYNGEIKNGKRDGQGAYSWKSGDTYTGDWDNDKMSGSGKYEFENGAVLDGTFSDDEFIEGTYEISTKYGDYTFQIENKKPTYVEIDLKNGTTYDGDMKNESMTGKAKIEYANGDTYSGKVINGEKSGRGKYTWDNGAVYDGYWAKDTMEGKGTYTYSSGDVLTGNFVSGKPNGTCSYEDSDDDTTYTTKWENGKCVSAEEDD
jgi:hypothetical protein